MRIFLFILMQVAVLIVVNIVGYIILSVLGIRLDGQSYTGLMIMCVVFGFTGSLISLFASKFMCKKAYGVQVISKPRTAREQFLVRTVGELAGKAGFSMPEVGIYNAAEPNAFATGASRNNALVAVSSGLLDSMSEDEVKGVLGHEVTHISNGDMVTMSLLQGVLNTFVYFFSYIAAMAVSSMAGGRDGRSEEGGSGGSSTTFMMTNMLFQTVFGVLANIILMWFSRHREYRADEGSARLEGRSCMIGALQALQRGTQPTPSSQGQFSALCINGAGGLSELFMSHPPLEKRIAALRALQIK